METELGNISHNNPKSETTLAKMKFLRNAWDVIGLSEVRRSGKAYTVLGNGDVFCYRGLTDNK